MPHSSRFWDRIAERYARQPVADEDAYQRKLALTREHLRPDMHVLELGCGTGSTALVHAPYVKEIRAVDLSEKMLEIARRKAKAAGIENVRFERADVDGFTAPDGSYDMVLALSLLHLLEDRTPAIASIRRLLAPGGTFVSSTVCLGDGLGFFRWIGPIGRALGLMPLLRVFTSDELVESIEAEGFEIEHVWRPDDGRTAFVIARKPA